jgi:hypothetical protein
VQLLRAEQSASKYATAVSAARAALTAARSYLQSCKNK